MIKRNSLPRYISPLIAVVSTSLLLGGCAAQKQTLRDPAYAPVVGAAPNPPAPRFPAKVNPVQQVMTGSIYNASTSRFLFEDYRARRVGDVLTVILMEQTNASKKAGTTTKKASNVELPSPKLFGRHVTRGGVPILETSVNGKIDFAGEGDSRQSNSLKGNITVSVSQVLPNGNLVVRGEKLLYLNQGSEVVRIRGIVRPVDISANNSIYSNQIANAEITYKGKGVIADSNEAGWLTRFFNSKWWPL
jgi:flagellar L-ring protein precursor FlgH